MNKKIFTVNEGKVASNTAAGISFVIVSGILYFTLEPKDFYSYLFVVAVALVVAGLVYTIAEVICKKKSK